VGEVGQERQVPGDVEQPQAAVEPTTPEAETPTVETTPEETAN